MSDLKQKLVHAVTRFDRNEEEKSKKNPKKSYNRYALAQYLARVDDLHKDLIKGISPGEAINRHFIGSLARHLHRTLKTGDTDKDSKRRELYKEEQMSPIKEALHLMSEKKLEEMRSKFYEVLNQKAAERLQEMKIEVATKIIDQ